MPRWWGMAVLAVVATSCGVVRITPVETPTPATETTGERLRDADLAHPKTLAWVHRICARSAGRPERELGVAKSGATLPRIEAILEEHGLPRALVGVPAVESRFDANARGRHGELGMWQIRPATARRFGLRVGGRSDERRHVERGTVMAARYLAWLHARYGDWLLALAAYNAGEGRIDRAMRRSGQRTFWDLAERGVLPHFTRDYVPRVLAAAQLIAAPQSCG